MLIHSVQWSLGSQHILMTHVSILGFNVFREDHMNSNREGVCSYLNSSYPSTRLTECDGPSIESLWVLIRRIPIIPISLIVLQLYG